MPDRKLCIRLFLLSVGVRLLALLLLGLPPEPFEYEDLSLSLLAGQGYQRILYGTIHHAQGPPLFAFLCAAIYGMTSHSQLAVIAIQIAASSALTIVTYSIAKKIGLSRTPCIIAALLPVFHPGLIVYAVKKLHPLSIDALLIAVTFLCVLKLPQSRHKRSFVLTGVLLGLTLLSRPTAGLFGIAAVSWLITYPGHWRRQPMMRNIAGMTLASLLVCTPWILRNAAYFHRFVFITTDTGELFWRGNNPNATGSAYTTDKRPIFQAAPEEFRRRIESQDEMGQYHLFLKEGLGFIQNHPARACRLLLKKWVSFWWFTQTQGERYPVLWMRLYQLFYGVILFLFVIGGYVLLARWQERYRPARNLLMLLFLSISLAQSLFYVEGRHRWGVESLMAIPAAIGITTLALQVRWRKPAPGKMQADKDPT